METLGYFFFGFLAGLLVALIGLVWAAEPAPRAPTKPVVDFDHLLQKGYRPPPPPPPPKFWRHK